MPATCPECGDTRVRVFVRVYDRLLCNACALFARVEADLRLEGLL